MKYQIMLLFLYISIPLKCEIFMCQVCKATENIIVDEIDDDTTAERLEISHDITEHYSYLELLINKGDLQKAFVEILNIIDIDEDEAKSEFILNALLQVRPFSDDYLLKDEILDNLTKLVDQGNTRAINFMADLYNDLQDSGT